MNQLEWLRSNGGSVIRWRVGNELLGDITNTEHTALASEVLNLPLVQGWLDRLTLGNFPVALDALEADSPHILGNIVHGSKSTCLENVLGKLAEFGLHAGMSGLDERALPLIKIFAWKPG